MVITVDDRVPDPDRKDAVKREGIARALAYMGLTPNTPVNEIKIDKGVHWFLHNSRIEGFARCGAVVKAVAVPTT